MMSEAKNPMELLEGGRRLPLVEDFYTIQGEGYHTGKAAYFIRLGGCDDDYLEEYARERYGMQRRDERVFLMED